MAELTIKITITQGDSALKVVASPKLVVLGENDSLVLDVDAASVGQQVAFGESEGGFVWDAGKKPMYSQDPGKTVTYSSENVGSWVEGINKMTVGSLNKAEVFRLVPVVSIGSRGIFKAGPAIPPVDVFLCPSVPDIVTAIDLANDLAFSYSQLYPAEEVSGLTAGYGNGTARFDVSSGTTLNVLFWLRSTVQGAVFASGTQTSPTWWYESQSATNQSASPIGTSTIDRWGDSLFQLTDNYAIPLKESVSGYFRTVLEAGSASTLIVSKDPTVVNKATSGQG